MQQVYHYKFSDCKNNIFFVPQALCVQLYLILYYIFLLKPAKAPYP